MNDEKTTATNINQFEPSLWNFIGQYEAKFALISLVDQLVNDRIAGAHPEYPVILIAGKPGWGRRTIAKALHNAVGNLIFKEAGWILGTSEDPYGFFQKSNEHTTFYIPNVTQISSTVTGQLISIIRDKYFIKSFPGRESETVPVENKLIILSQDKDHPINSEILKHVYLKCDLLVYSIESIYKILKQRVDYLGWRATDNTLRLICENSKHNPGDAIRKLQLCYMVSRAEDKNKITSQHAKKALVLSS